MDVRYDNLKMLHLMSSLFSVQKAFLFTHSIIQKHLLSSNYILGSLTAVIRVGTSIMWSTKQVFLISQKLFFQCWLRDHGPYHTVTVFFVSQLPMLPSLFVSSMEEQRAWSSSRGVDVGQQGRLGNGGSQRKRKCVRW